MVRRGPSTVSRTVSTPDASVGFATRRPRDRDPPVTPVGRLGDDEVAADEALNGAAVRLARDGRVHADETVTGGRIELPADPQQRESLLEQEAVTELLRRLWIERARWRS